MLQKNTIKNGKITLTVSVLVVLGILSCIQRNNYWDPLIYNPQTNPTVKSRDSLAIATKQANFALDSLKHVADSLKKIGQLSDAQLTIEMALADSVKTISGLITQKNADSRTQNAVLDTLQKKYCNSFKRVIDSIPLIDTLYVAMDFRLTQTQVLGLYRAADSIAKKYNALFDHDTVVPPQFLSAFKALTDSEAMYFYGLQKKQDSTNAVFDSNNNYFANTNMLVALDNQKIQIFNLNVQKTYPCRTPLTTADTIVKSFPQLKAGDTLFIAPGVFNVTALQIHSISGTPFAHIVFMGAAQGTTVFTALQDQSAILVDRSTKYVDFENITFLNCKQNGASVQDNSGPIMFKNCFFISNHGDGIHILDSDVLLRNCRFMANDSSGIFVKDSRLDVDNSLVANNRKNGISIFGNVTAIIQSIPDSVTISRATISDNDSDGVCQQGKSSNVTISKSLVTFNKRIGIHRENDVSANAPIVLSAMDLFLNGQQNFLSLPPFDSLHVQYRSEDPLYPNKANYDYSIGVGSSVPDSLGYNGR